MSSRRQFFGQVAAGISTVVLAPALKLKSPLPAPEQVCKVEPGIHRPTTRDIVAGCVRKRRGEFIYDHNGSPVCYVVYEEFGGFEQLVSETRMFDTVEVILAR